MTLSRYHGYTKNNQLFNMLDKTNENETLH